MKVGTTSARVWPISVCGCRTTDENTSAGMWGRKTQKPNDDIASSAQLYGKRYASMSPSPSAANAKITGCRNAFMVLAANDTTERCGRPAASELATDVARPHSLQ